MYAISDAKMYYTDNLKVYVGKQPKGPFSVSNSALALVDRLYQPIRETGQNLTTDNIFTSLELAELLLSQKITMKKTRALPPECVNEKNRPVGTMFAYRENCTIIPYIPKEGKNVLLTSNIHDDDSISNVTGKPEFVTDYNCTKGGVIVDTVDQLCANYNYARNARRWPMVIFYSLLNISAINSEIIFHGNNPKDNILRRHFLENLSFALMNNHLKARAYSEYILRTMRSRICEICHIDTEPNTGTETNGRYFFCSSKKNRKTRYFCKCCKKFICLEHRTVCEDCFQKHMTHDD
ncbi:hypothetical protein NQ318_014474 [Aromia moschata]|uniref:PiggyBac transposable element-derived protein domain-containing protein n=1 Tax=Aromia moschata TaxID=1265417 RepID=A0AAV8YL52_9CUCU|nr:hypothetical protein NQ318_014474 [Aromia moschata]